MSDKKLQAKKEMLQKMSKNLHEDSKKSFGDELKAKKKVIVEAPDDKSLEKGLSMAQKLLKAKFGDAGLDEESMEEADSEMDEDCPACDNEGCEECTEMEEASEEMLEE